MTEEQQAEQIPQQEDDRGYTPPEVGDSNLAKFLQANKIDFGKLQSGSSVSRSPEEQRALGILKAVS